MLRHSDVEAVTDLGNGHQRCVRRGGRTPDDCAVRRDDLNGKDPLVSTQQAGSSPTACRIQVSGDFADPRRGGAVDSGQHGPIQHCGKNHAGHGRATNTTVAATKAERADMPQLHDRPRRIGISPPLALEFRHLSRTMFAGPDMREVHQWFLHRGLPLVMTRRVRSRSLIERSAPVVSGIGAVISLTMMLAGAPAAIPISAMRLASVLTLLLIAAPFALYLLP